MTDEQRRFIISELKDYRKLKSLAEHFDNQPLISEHTKSEIRSRIYIIESGLAELTQNEKTVLEYFYICGMKYGEAIVKLGEKLNYSERQLNRIRNGALQKLCLFAFEIYGSNMAVIYSDSGI